MTRPSDPTPVDRRSWFTDHPHFTAAGFVIALLVPVMVFLVCVRPTPSPPTEPTPLPLATPTPGPDSGFHEAIVDDSNVEIDKRYSDMSDTERGEANDYSHQYPDGH